MRASGRRGGRLPLRAGGVMAAYAGRFRVAPCFLAPVVRRGGAGRVLRSFRVAEPVVRSDSAVGAFFPERTPDLL